MVTCYLARMGIQPSVNKVLSEMKCDKCLTIKNNNPKKTFLSKSAADLPVLITVLATHRKIDLPQKNNWQRMREKKKPRK